MSDDTSKLDRRTLIAGAATVGAVGLAGCAAEEDEGNESEEDGDGLTGLPARPQLPGDPDAIGNDATRFLVESADYQNQMLEQIHDEVSD